jgi:hypothetical protein
LVIMMDKISEDDAVDIIMDFIDKQTRMGWTAQRDTAFLQG